MSVGKDRRRMDAGDRFTLKELHANGARLSLAISQYKGEPMDQINVNTVANIVTAVCAVLIAIKIL